MRRPAHRLTNEPLGVGSASATRDANADDLDGFTTVEDLIRRLRARRIALGLSQIAVDAIAGLADGYTAKVEVVLTNPGAKNARSIGRESLPLLLGALGLVMAVVPAAGRHSRKANSNNALAGAPRKIPSIVDRARKGAAIQRARMTEEQYKAHQRKAARSRWAKYRSEKAAAKRSKHANEMAPPSRQRE